jgi:hypothetical protein
MSEQAMKLYWEGDRSEVRERYEAMFATRFMGEDIEPDASITATDDIERILAGLYGQIRLPEAIEEQIREAWELIVEPERIYALYHLLLLNNEKWSTSYLLEGMGNFFGTMAATHVLHAIAPESVFPIDSEQRYDRLRSTLNALGITYDDREDRLSIEVVLSIQEAVQTFRAERNLEPWQMWALVYDLGPRLLAPPKPYPKDHSPRIWITAAGPDDFDRTDQHTGNDRDTWSINLKAKRGDIVLMYCLAPRSSLRAVYRCDCDAYRDPTLNLWTGVWTEITDKLEIPRLTLKEMKLDPVV